MAKYGKKSQDKVEEAMHEYKRGELKSGPEGKGGPVQSREQAIAIGLSEAREEGGKVPDANSGNGGDGGNNNGGNSGGNAGGGNAKAARKSSGRKSSAKKSSA